ncbi:MAG: YggU family protein [Candidatus Hydrogenedentes bacterium]|nr:YggU family protein [Candidatus Hydrogenedentota bacterium]
MGLQQRPMDSIEYIDGGVRVRVRVQPRSSHSGVSGEREGRLCIRLTAPPVDGEANAALIAFLAKALGIPKRSVTIVSGERAREKTVEIGGVCAEDVRERLLPGDSRSVKDACE